MRQVRLSQGDASLVRALARKGSNKKKIAPVEGHEHVTQRRAAGSVRLELCFGPKNEAPFFLEIVNEI